MKSPANQLTASIVDYVRLNGGFISRINTQGTRRGGIWTKTNATVGFPDLHGLFNKNGVAIPFYVEVKYGDDQLSEIQKKLIAEIEKAGGLVYVARNIEGFYTWFGENLKK
jgi:hypothetical protein